MNKAKLKTTILDIAKDLLVAFVIVSIVMLALFAYCGIWPPMVVVESGSMQRYDDKSIVGAIDTGDMVFVKTVGGMGDIVTYVDGEAGDYSKYGNYGDVIIYRPNGMSNYADGTKVVPIIHRPVVWIEANDTLVTSSSSGVDYANYTFDVPSLNMLGTTENIVLTNYGYWDETVTISLTGLLKYYEHVGKVPHGGFITMGDHNVPAYDQPLFGSYEPVLPEWIVGKAWGEIPWFGLLKLKVTGANVDGVPGNSWTGLFISLALILFLPFAFDYMVPKIKSRMDKRKKSLERPEGDSGGAQADALPKNAGPPVEGEEPDANPDKSQK